MTGWLALLNHLATTASVGGMVWLAIMFWQARRRNGPFMERISEYMAFNAIFFAATWVMRLDGILEANRSDLVPGVSLIWLLRDWVWVGHLIFLGLLIRLWRSVP